MSAGSDLLLATTALLDIDVQSSKPPVILVVEDEALVRLFAICAIEDAGFVAIEASNAGEASDLLNAGCDIRW